ncbi:MAG: transposase [Flavobacteriales bacterium]|nr:transposase [Flavobacteriales bacterium]
MLKVQRISGFQGSLNFNSPGEHFSKYYQRFGQSDLGKIHGAVPWDDLVKALRLKPSKKGPASIFSPKGKTALMFLKNYSGCSDKRLIEQINGNIDYQFFCDLYLGSEHRLINYKIVSEIRCELGGKLDVDKLQRVLAGQWRGWMDQTDCMLTDATCYESEVRYPTNQKLLWESVTYSYGQMQVICKYLKVKLPRTKYLKWKERYFVYSRKRKRTIKERRVLTRSLLMLLNKLNTALGQLERGHDFQMPKRYYKRRKTIKTIYRQQHHLFTTGEKPKNRIVSIHKDYLRPIVRGKEIKSVEFGAKVNKIQIDGINFIEHISFDAFNESTHFKSSVYLSQVYMAKQVKIVGADAIYATNKNRRFATGRKIRTDFKRKGRASKHEPHRKQLAAMITKERASRLEGSFGNEKEHYHLKKIKARTKQTEILWIFFGIHTANALQIGYRMARDDLQEAA